MDLNKTKFIVITGGVISGIGKGITTSSIGVIMKMIGARVTAIKIDPYLNVDAGTMSPYEHGECFVLNDGGETDLDLGNYERFLNINLKSISNITTGKIYSNVIKKEREGKYLGKTVQIIPHITNEIISHIENVVLSYDDTTKQLPNICMIEVGGTIGDIESMPFVEAIRQLQLKVGKKNFCLVHVSMVPEIRGEHKTKPTQHSVKELRALGLTPDFIACRSEKKIPINIRDKIAQHCNLETNHVLSIQNLNNIYCLPLELLEKKMDLLIYEKLELKKLNLKQNILFSQKWKSIVNKSMNLSNKIVIGIIGKYVSQEDSYISIKNALNHASINEDVFLELKFIDSELLEKNELNELYLCNGILIPGGFGDRGINGKLIAINYARIHNIPFFGICLGMQLAIIEFSRNILKIKDASSSEFDSSIINTEKEVVIYMPENNKELMGGTMRLGLYKTLINENSIAYNIYKNKVIEERHRHRYEINPKIITKLENNNMKVSGMDDTKKRVEIIELNNNHPFFFCCQFHPEYKSRPMSPSPPFISFLQAIKKINNI